MEWYRVMSWGKIPYLYSQSKMPQGLNKEQKSFLKNYYNKENKNRNEKNIIIKYNNKERLY